MSTCCKWLTTINNPDTSVESHEEIVMRVAKHPQFKYVCGQLEKGESGTVHLQIFTQFKTSVRGAALSKIYHGHNEMVKKDNGARAYCMKTDTRIEGPWEFGKYSDVKDIGKNKPKVITTEQALQMTEEDIK